MTLLIYKHRSSYHSTPDIQFASMRLSAIYTSLLFALAAVRALPTGCVSHIRTSFILNLTYIIQEVYIFADTEDAPLVCKSITVCVFSSNFVTSVSWLMCLKADARGYLTMAGDIC